MFNPADIPNWMVLIYERHQRFRPEAATKMIRGLVDACEAVGELSKQFRLPPAVLNPRRDHDQSPAGAREMGIGSRQHHPCTPFCLFHRPWLTPISSNSLPLAKNASANRGPHQPLSSSFFRRAVTISIPPSNSNRIITYVSRTNFLTPMIPFR
jgi:hypothetical protein